MRKTVFALSVVSALVAGLLPSAVAGAPDRSGNVRVVAQHAFPSGTELGYGDGILYAGQNNGRDAFGSVPNRGGVFVFDTTGESGLDLVAKIDCAGYDHDVKIVRPGLLAVAHHQTTRPECNPGTTGNGIFLVDVSDPANPRRLGGVSVGSGTAHTISIHPSGNYVYVNPGGLTNGGGTESIVDVSNPLAPKVVATYRPSRIGCHDLGFHPTEPYAFCAGFGEVQVWDVSNPTEPETVGRIVNPAIQFAHNAVVSPDGTKLVINDEAFALHECETGTSVFGSLWIYDITIPEVPVLAGRIAPEPSRATVGTYPDWTPGWCTAHNYNFIPDTNVVVASWFTGGTTVHDISDPLLPRKLAWYRPDDAVAYTAHWFEGRIYINDAGARGVEVIEVNDLPLGGSGGDLLFRARPRVDLTPVLVPQTLPDRPGPLEVRDAWTARFCVIPAI